MRGITMMIMLNFAVLAYARGPKAGHTVDKLDRFLDDKSVCKQIEEVMADPKFQRQVNHAAKNVEVMMADPNFQKQAMRVVEDLKVMMVDPNSQQRAKLNTEQELEAQRTNKEQESNGKLLDSLVDNLFDRALAARSPPALYMSAGRESRFQDTDLNKVMRAKLGCRATPSLHEGRLFDRALKASRFPDSDLQNVMQAKPSHLGTSSVHGCGSSFGHRHLAVVPKSTGNHLRQRVPVMSIIGKSVFPSEPDSLRNSRVEIGVHKSESIKEPWKQKIDELRRQFANAAAIAIALSPNAALAENIYNKVDKTGFIGGAASTIEDGIENIHNTLEGAGLTSNTWGLSIALFTLLVKTFTLPLNALQVKTGLKSRQLSSYVKKIQTAFPLKSQEQNKAQAMVELYAYSNVSAVSGCYPSLVQVPVLISLYQALRNLIAEGKAKESFLWLPSLEGPVYDAEVPGSWFASIFRGNPELGWDDTKAFLTLPLILIVTQTISAKLLEPERAPGQTTNQEKLAQDLLYLLPFFVGSLSLRVPAGLSVYWIINNILTTTVTLGVKAATKTEDLPPEVQTLMDKIDRRELPGQTLRDAAYSANVKQVEEFLQEARANPNELDDEGRSPLVFAVRAGSVPSVEALIRARAQVGMVDLQGNTPLYYAAGYGHAEIVNVLLNAGADVIPNTAGESPADAARVDFNNTIRNDTALMARLEVDPGVRQRLQRILEEGKAEEIVTRDLQGVQKLLAQGVDPNVIVDQNGLSALGLAAATGVVPVVKALITARANVGFADGKGNTPLFYAAGYGRAEVVRLLLDAGANVTVNAAGQSPADAVRASPDNPVRSDTTLMDRLEVDSAEVGQAPGQTLIYAAQTANLQQVEELLVGGRDPNEADSEGRSCLHFASGAGSVSVVKALIAARANIEAVDSLGSTPLWYAAAYGRADTALSLLDAGANVTVDNSGASPADAVRAYSNNPILSDKALMDRLEHKPPAADDFLQGEFPEDDLMQSDFPQNDFLQGEFPPQEQSKSPTRRFTDLFPPTKR